MTAGAVRVLHLSDIHCGRNFAAHHMAAAEALAAASRCDAIVVSGDLAQRARESELRSARVILDRLKIIAPLIVVPGNHDAQWWHAPFGVGAPERIHERWRAWIQAETEPTLRVPGVSMIGLNSAPGIMPWTLTWNPRDIRVKGGLTDAQLADARARVAACPPGDLRVVILHHNVLRGPISHRWGMARPQVMLDALAGMGADIICSGHDHQEQTEVVTRRTGTVTITTSSTLAKKPRGHRPSALNVIEGHPAHVSVTAWTFDAPTRAYVRGATVQGPRASH